MYKVGMWNSAQACAVFDAVHDLLMQLTDILLQGLCLYFAMMQIYCVIIIFMYEFMCE